MYNERDCITTTNKITLDSKINQSISLYVILEKILVQLCMGEFTNPST